MSRGEETLRMPGGLEPLHAPLPLARRLMGVFSAVVEVMAGEGGKHVDHAGVAASTGGEGRATMSQMLGRGISGIWAAIVLVLAMGMYAHAASSLDDIRARGLIRCWGRALRPWWCQPCCVRRPSMIPCGSVRCAVGKGRTIADEHKRRNPAREGITADWTVGIMQGMDGVHNGALLPVGYACQV
jgi:hypothetical protein